MRARSTSGVDIQIEVETLDQLREALAAGAASVLLDNFTLAQMREAVAITGGRALLEVSGGVTLDQLRGHRRHWRRPHLDRPADQGRAGDRLLDARAHAIGRGLIQLRRKFPCALVDLSARKLGMLRRLCCRLAGSLLACFSSAHAQTAPVPAPDWPTPSATEQAFDAKTFSGLERHIAESLTDISSVVVIRRGRVAFEYYASGQSRDSLHGVESVTKSVLSTLVGIAVAQGRISDLDQPIIAVMPELADANDDPRARQPHRAAPADDDGRIPG